MLRDSVQPPVQRRFKSGDNIFLPSFSNIAKENPRPFRRVLCALLMRGNITTSATYDGTERECKDLR